VLVVVWWYGKYGVWCGVSLFSFGVFVFVVWCVVYCGVLFFLWCARGVVVVWCGVVWCEWFIMWRFVWCVASGDMVVLCGVVCGVLFSVSCTSLPPRKMHEGLHQGTPPMPTVWAHTSNTSVTCTHGTLNPKGWVANKGL
jgi:hypothetical protein